MTNKEASDAIRKSLDGSQASFSWPTDGCSYEQHVRFVDHRNKHWKGGSVEEFKRFALDYADALLRERLTLRERTIGDAKHTLVIIGDVGQKRCYLDLETDEAVERYCAQEGCSEKDALATVQLVDFEDEFRAYDVW